MAGPQTNKPTIQGKNLIEKPHCSICGREPTDKYTVTVSGHYGASRKKVSVLLCIFCFTDGLDVDVRNELYRQWYGRLGDQP